MKFLKLMFFLVSTFLYAQDATIEIVKKIESAPKIMIQDGTGDEFDDIFKNRFFKMLIGDLKVTTHFNINDIYVQRDYSKDPITDDKSIDLILQYKLVKGDGSSILASAKLSNAKNKKTISEKFYDINNVALYPFLSHQIISDANDNIGANKIDWMKRYVLISKNVAPKQSDIVLADYTLTFQQTIVSGGLNLFPKWANEAQDSFYYTSFSDTQPTLYKIHIQNAQKDKIISSDGMLVASDVSKMGDKLLLTMAPNGQADIYLYDLNTKALKQVTFYKGIDVNGGFVDDENTIVFVSDRLGYPNIFSKNIDSRGVEQMVYHGRNNVSCSSSGNYIVYSSRDKGGEFGPITFNLYLISTKTDYIRQITATGKNLFPRFSQDGKSVMFIKSYGEQSALGLIRLDENQIFHFPLDVGSIQSIDW